MFFCLLIKASDSNTNIQHPGDKNEAAIFDFNAEADRFSKNTVKIQFAILELSEDWTQSTGLLWLKNEWVFYSELNVDNWNDNCEAKSEAKSPLRGLQIDLVSHVMFLTRSDSNIICKRTV